MFYYYEPLRNEIFRLPSLQDNHCRGGMIYIKYFNSIFCISGKYTKNIEFFNMKYLKINDDDKSDKYSRQESRRETRKQTKKDTRKNYSRKNSKRDISRTSSKNFSRQNSRRDIRRVESDRSRSSSNNSRQFIRSKTMLSRSSSKNRNNIETSNSLKKNDLDKINFMDNENLKWEEFTPLNISRNYACFAVHNDTYLYVFFGYNQLKGYLNTIEKIDLKEPVQFDIIKYHNPKELDLHRNSMSCCFANSDEIYILGGTIRDKPTDEIIKYNFKHETFYKTEMSIPGLNENEYFRFWEESTFSPLSSQGYAVNSDDDFTFGLLDARDKVHLFNIRNFKYNII